MTQPSIFEEIKHSTKAAIEQPTNEVCPKCDEVIIFRCTGMARLQGHRILLGEHYCPNCGVQKPSKKQRKINRKISKAITNFREFRAAC